MNKFIPITKPDINSDDISAVVSVLESGMLVQGKKVLSLEEKFANFLNVDYSSAVSNGTATLHLALLAAGIKLGDEVIVPAFSYIATANVVELVGATPIFVDIDISTFNINVNLIEKAITSKTKAIIPVHEFGLPADMDSILEIAKQHNLVVIEDAACALGAKYKNRFAGTMGDFGSFSLHPRKAITSGEGGILLAKKQEHTNFIKSMRNHGIEMNEGVMEFIYAGYNYRMTDFQAALVSSQFERLETKIQTRQEIAKKYLSEIKNDKIKLPIQPLNYLHSWQTFHIILDDSINRTKMITELSEKGIGANYGAQCMPYMKFYLDKYKLDCEKNFPSAMKSYKQGLAIPMYENLDKDEINYIIDTLNKI